MQALELELALIGSESRRRTTEHATGGIRREAPLPTTAWTLLITSSELEQLDDEIVKALSNFYRQVDAANYLAAQGPMYLLIANTASDGAVHAGFLEQARLVTTEPFNQIADTVDEIEAQIKAELAK